MSRLGPAQLMMGFHIAGMVSAAVAVLSLVRACHESEAADSARSAAEAAEEAAGSARRGAEKAEEAAERLIREFADALGDTESWKPTRVEHPDAGFAFNVQDGYTFAPESRVCMLVQMTEQSKPAGQQQIRPDLAHPHFCDYEVTAGEIRARQAVCEFLCLDTQGIQALGNK